MAAPNVLDRVIGWAAPQAALRRVWARTQLARAYEAASPRDPWKPRRAGAGPNADHAADAATLRAKARSLEQNVDWIAAGLSNLTAQRIGTGIASRFEGPQADVLNTLLAAWSSQADADGLLDWPGLQALIDRTEARDGEGLIRLRWRQAGDGLPVPLQLQALEIDWLDSTRNEPYGTNTIVNGIEYDILGRRVAYWLWDEHPGESRLSLRGLRRASRRVEASQIIHYFRPTRPGMQRGITRLAQVIAGARDLHLYEDAELARKNTESRFGVLASGDISALQNPSAIDGLYKEGDMGELPGGSIVGLPPGTTITTVEPQAAPGHVAYVNARIKRLSSGGGWTYEMATGDVSEANYSSMRAGMLIFRRQTDMERWLYIIPRLIEPVMRAFEEAAILAGKVRRQARTLHHTPPRWEHVNPSEDVKAETDSVANGTSSISDLIRARGDDPDRVFAELATDINTLRTSGVLDVMLLMLRGVTEAGPGGDGAGAGADPKTKTASTKP